MFFFLGTYSIVYVETDLEFFLTLPKKQKQNKNKKTKPHIMVGLKSAKKETHHELSETMDKRREKFFRIGGYH